MSNDNRIRRQHRRILSGLVGTVRAVDFVELNPARVEASAGFARGRRCRCRGYTGGLVGEGSIEVAIFAYPSYAADLGSMV